MHTQGKLRVTRGAQNHAFSLEGETTTVALIPHATVKASDIVDARRRGIAKMEMTEGNAQRLATCWNFCEGIETDVLQVSLENGVTLDKMRETQRQLLEVAENHQVAIKFIKQLVHAVNAVLVYGVTDDTRRMLLESVSSIKEIK